MVRGKVSLLLCVARSPHPRRTGASFTFFSLSCLGRGRFPALIVAIAFFSACAPIQDPNHPDQCPDINYSITALKDAQQIGSIEAIDIEVTSRMAGTFPGCAIAIVEGGEIVYMKGYGFSHFNVNTVPPVLLPFTTTTVAGIGSVSKVLTSIAVMRLVELGYVDLETPISAYFPHAVPTGWNSVTVRQLLSHRGGFARDPDSSLPGALTPARLDAAFGPKASQHPRYAIWEFLYTSLGAPDPAKIGAYEYSNIGYTILGALIDYVTLSNGFQGGLAGYERFVWSLVANAKDSALTACLNHPWRKDDIVGLAQSYDANWNELNTNWSGWQSAAGGWSMTIGDLARIALALKNNQILTAASLAEMRVNQGNQYGLGLQLMPKANRVAYSHGGVIGGFRTQFTVWPNEDVAVVVFANADNHGVGPIGDAVSEAWMNLPDPPQIQLSRRDTAFMATATFRVSQDHFNSTEQLVRNLLDSYSETRTVAALARVISSQGDAGRKLVDHLQRDIRDLEGAASLFLDLFGRDRNAGP
jgi:CubicO group peptidase (beta-lactamase class C family)